MHFAPGSQMATIYGQTQAEEDFRCNYGFNAAFAENFRNSQLRVVGYENEGELRAIELPGHRFFLATLVLPQRRSQPGRPQPLIAAYIQAAEK